MKLIFRPYTMDKIHFWAAPYSSEERNWLGGTIRHHFVFMKTFRMIMGKAIDSSYAMKDRK